VVPTGAIGKKLRRYQRCIAANVKLVELRFALITRKQVTQGVDIVLPHQPVQPITAGHHGGARPYGRRQGSGGDGDEGKERPRQKPKGESCIYERSEQHKTAGGCGQE